MSQQNKPKTTSAKAWANYNFGQSIEYVEAVEDLIPAKQWVVVQELSQYHVSATYNIQFNYSQTQITQFNLINELNTDLFPAFYYEPNNQINNIKNTISQAFAQGKVHFISTTQAQNVAFIIDECLIALQGVPDDYLNVIYQNGVTWNNPDTTFAQYFPHAQNWTLNSPQLIAEPVYANMAVVGVLQPDNSTYQITITATYQQFSQKEIPVNTVWEYV